MNLPEDFKRHGHRVRRSRIRLTWTTTLLVTSMGHALAQVTQHTPVSASCVELNQTVMNQLEIGKFADGELAVSAVLASSDDHSQRACAGLVLNNMAALMSISGRVADAERLAERSVLILEKAYSPHDRVLLRPLQVLAAARFELGKTARAREALKKMQSIRVERPDDQALIHGMAAALFEREGKRPEAEGEYLAALRAWEAAGKGETAEAAAVLNGLGSHYIELGRLTEAQQALDGAFAIFSRAKDTVPNDRIKLLQVRGVLHARQGDWREAEQDFHDALAMSDREAWADPIALRSLLTSYAYILRKNHHGREAHSIEVRAAAIQTDRTTAAIVDLTELLPKAKPTK